MLFTGCLLFGGSIGPPATPDQQHYEAFLADGLGFVFHFNDLMSAFIMLVLLVPANDWGMIQDAYVEVNQPGRVCGVCELVCW